MSATHLWECEHPYYWTEGSFHANGNAFEHDSWAEFIAEMGEADEDYNLLGRWDWDLDTDEDDKPVLPIGAGTLKLRYVSQRKGYTYSFDVKVRPEDEPAVRAWLAGRWEHIQRLWAPFGATP